MNMRQKGTIFGAGHISRNAPARCAGGEVEVNRPTALEHLRPHDTHQPIMFEPGIYEVRRQREYTPEGFRRVED